MVLICPVSTTKDYSKILCIGADQVGVADTYHSVKLHETEMWDLSLASFPSPLHCI